MKSRWEKENGMQTPAFPRVGMLALPEEPVGEKSCGVATVALPYGVLLLLVDGRERGDDPGAVERLVLHAVKRVMQNARLNPEDVRSALDLLRQSIHTANGDLFQRSGGGQGSKCSASCALVLVTRGRAYVAHVGNARAYLVRNNAANRLTRDHTTAQTWIDHGIMTEEQARLRPEAHSLSRALGEKARLEPEVRSLPLRMERGDVVLLCSAGIHRYLDDDEMGSMVARLEPEHACQEMCEVASGRSKSPDCKTLVYQSGPLRQGNYPRLLQQRRQRKQKRALAIAGGLVGLVAVVALAYSLWTATPTRTAADIRTPRRDQQGATLAEVEPEVISLAFDRAPQELVDIIASPPGPEPSVMDVVSAPEIAPVRVDVDAAEAPTTVLEVISSGPDLVPHEAVAQDVVVSIDVVDEGLAPRPADAGAAAGQWNSEQAASSEPIWAQPVSAKAQADCQGGGELLRGDRRRVRDLRHLVSRGLEHLSGPRKDASAAARQAHAAAKTLRNSSDIVKERCSAHVQDLLDQAKARYLHLSWVSATRAINNLENRSYHCGKAYRMARDAQRLGATDEELKEARRICATE